MRHLWPGLCGSAGSNPVGGFQTNTLVTLAPSAGMGDPMLSIFLVLAGLSGVIARDGLPTQNSALMLSVPGGRIH